LKPTGFAVFVQYLPYFQDNPVKNGKAALNMENNQDKSAAIFCCQVATWVQIYFVKNHKIAKNLTTTKAREKNKHIFGIIGTLYFLCIFD
jgi:hypothetical protein